MERSTEKPKCGEEKGILDSRLFTYARGLKDAAARAIDTLRQNKQKEFCAFAVLMVGAIGLGGYRGNIIASGLYVTSLMPLMYSVYGRSRKADFSDSTDRVEKNPKVPRLLTAAEWGVGLASLGLVDYTFSTQSWDMLQLDGFVMGGNAAQVLFRENLEVLLSKIPKLRQDKLQ